MEKLKMIYGLGNFTKPIIVQRSKKSFEMDESKKIY